MCLSGMYLQVPQVLCSRALCLVGPGLWSGLPEDLRDSTSVDIYIAIDLKISNLKTYLFFLAFT